MKKSQDKLRFALCILQPDKRFEYFLLRRLIFNNVDVHVFFSDLFIEIPKAREQCYLGLRYFFECFADRFLVFMTRCTYADDILGPFFSSFIGTDKV